MRACESSLVRQSAKINRAPQMRRDSGRRSTASLSGADRPDSRMARRIVAALLFPLLLNAMALGAGLARIGDSACDRTSAVQGQIAAPMSMSEMQSMDMGNAPTDGATRQLPHNTGCNLPSAPGCTSAALCTPTATISVARFRLSLHATTIRAAGRIMQAPDSPDRAPELPPPRV
jgi:hypothetical protein